METGDAGFNKKELMESFPRRIPDYLKDLCNCRTSFIPKIVVHGYAGDEDGEKTQNPEEDSTDRDEEILKLSEKYNNEAVPEINEAEDIVLSSEIPAQKGDMEVQEAEHLGKRKGNDVYQVKSSSGGTRLVMGIPKKSKRKPLLKFLQSLKGFVVPEEDKAKELKQKTLLQGLADSVEGSKARSKSKWFWRI